MWTSLVWALHSSCLLWKPKRLCWFLTSQSYDCCVPGGGIVCAVVECFVSPGGSVTSLQEPPDMQLTLLLTLCTLRDQPSLFVYTLRTARQTACCVLSKCVSAVCMCVIIAWWTLTVFTAVSHWPFLCQINIRLFFFFVSLGPIEFEECNIAIATEGQ